MEKPKRRKLNSSNNYFANVDQMSWSEVTGIDEVQASIKPEKFWDKYIRQRKPAIISQIPAEMQNLNNWNNDYLKAKAGSTSVNVEVRSDPSQHFGKGNKQPTNFTKILDSIASHNTNLYLTTQEAQPAPDGHPELFAPPTSLLATDFPMQPALTGNLIPQQINMWMGSAQVQGASSGLHHDYHDNLYVLLRGKKRFRLYPPLTAPLMYTHGKLSKIHSNGRIIYKSQGDVLPDGSDAKEVKAWTRKHLAEKELAAAEQAVAQGKAGAQVRLEKAERQLDTVLGAALLGDNDDEWGGGNGFIDDYDDFEQLHNSKKSAKHDDNNEPDSFSKIDLSLPKAKLMKKFPLFPGVEAAIECELTAGQCLFLPAGWFHEVTSFDADGDDSNKAGEEDKPGHLALNFWFHPPDNLNSSGGFDKPYTSEYWPAVWAGRKHRYEQQRQEVAVRSTGGGGGIRKKKVSRQAQAEAYRALRGYYGVGRRQHLYQFINLTCAAPEDEDDEECF